MGRKKKSRLQTEYEKRRQTEYPYFHQPREVSKAFLTTQKSIIYDIDTDEKNSLTSRELRKSPIFANSNIEPLNRAMFSLAGAYPYLFERICYLCTHYADFIEKSDKEYYFAEVSWGEFCKGIKRKEKFQKELSRFDGSPKVLDIGDRYVKVAPIIINIYSKSKNEISIKNAFEILSDPVEYITIRFYKPLFKNYLDGGGNYHSQPVGWYDTIQDVIEQKKLHTNPLGVLKTWNYLIFHDNSIGGKKLVNLYDLLMHVDTQAIEIKKNKMYIKDNRAKAFLFDTIAVLQETTQQYKSILNFTLDGFIIPENIEGEWGKLSQAEKIYLILKGLEATKGKAVLGITRNPAIPDPMKQKEFHFEK